MKLRDIINEDWDDGKPWADRDGWDEAYFEEAGIMPWIEKVEELAYEIRNARRGTSLRGKELQDVLDYLYGLEEALGSVISNVSNDI